MSFKKITLAVASLIVLTGSAMAAMSPSFVELGAGPIQWIMTPEESTRWKSIRSDSEAETFLAVFWARRDPTPATPANEFRDGFEAKVKLADTNYGYQKTAGSMTDRGRVFVVFGAPNRLRKKGPGAAAPNLQGGFDADGEVTADQPSSPEEAWIYDADRVPAGVKAKEMTFIFVDSRGIGDFRISRSPTNMTTVIREANQGSLANPEITKPPVYASAVPAAPVAAPAPVEEKMPTSFATESIATAVAELEASPKNPYPEANVTWGEFITPSGDYYVALSIFVPASRGLSPTDALTFFAAVKDEAGAMVAAVEAPAVLAASKGDFYFHKSLKIPAGKYTGTIGLAKDGKPVLASKVAMDPKPLSKDAASSSSLILSNNIFALTEAQGSTDPFAFGGMKVIPKGDRAFSQADELWYFVELRNPGLKEDGSAGIQSKMDMEGKVGTKTVKMGSPLQEVVAEPLKGVAGHFAVGGSIPLSGFKPGDYTLKIKLIDTVSQKTFETTATFKVAAAAAAAPVK